MQNFGENEMKSKAKSKIIIIITIGIILAFLPMITTMFSFITGNSIESSKYSENHYIDKNLKLSKISEKIHLINNSGWITFKSTGNCTGNGNYTDPYVIEDLVIDANNTGSGILIENSDVYFRIENCTVYNSRGSLNAGIKLYNVTNAQLIDNNCSSNADGISLRFSYNNTISENTANNNYRNGIGLYSSYNNTISENTANDNSDGMELDESDNNTISGNTANSNEWCGINLLYSDNNTISGNTANYNEVYGITLSRSNDNTISGNSFIGNLRCYSESSCEGNIFENNYCENRADLSFLALLITLVVLFTAIPLTMMGMIRYERRKYNTFPKYGIISLIFDMLGLITLVILEFSGLKLVNYFMLLIATPFTIIGSIYGYAGYKSKRDTTSVLGVLGTVIGIGLFFVSIYPFLGLILVLGGYV